MENESLTEYKGRGRPRQPYCPDCLKAGRQVLKHGTQPYCKECGARRHRAVRRATNEGISTEVAILLDIKEENEALKKENVALQEMLMRDSTYAEYVNMIRQLRMHLRTVLDNRDAWMRLAKGEQQEDEPLPGYSEAAATKIRTLIEEAYRIGNTY